MSKQGREICRLWITMDLLRWKKFIRYNIVNIQTAEKQLKDFNNTVENGKN